MSTIAKIKEAIADRICFTAESDKDFPMTDACVYRSSANGAAHDGAWGDAPGFVK